MVGDLFLELGEETEEPGPPMPAVGTGSLCVALDGAEELLAQSPTFQAVAGVDADGLKARHIFYGRNELEEAAEAGDTLIKKASPYVVLHAGFHGYVQIGQGTRYCLGNEGGIAVEIVAAASIDESYKQGYRTFTNFISAVLDEVANNVGRDTYFPFNHFELLEQPWRPNRADRQSDDYWVAVYLLRYEIES